MTRRIQKSKLSSATSTKILRSEQMRGHRWPESRHIITDLRDRRGFRSHWAETSAKNSDSCCQIWQIKTWAPSLNKIRISWSSYLGQASKNYSLFLWSLDLIGCPVFYMSINLWYISDPNLGRWDHYSSLGDALLFFSLSFFLLTEPHYIAKCGLKLSLLR